MTYTSQKTYFSTYINGESPYTITLDNDSATIGATAEGVIDNTLLEKISTITVTVYHGNENITDDCEYFWKTEGGTLNNTDTNTVYFSELTSDTASTTVSVRKNGQLLGIKSFSISKSRQGEQGEDAITYMLSVSPTSFNKTTHPSVTPTFVVTKYVGEAITTNTAVQTDEYEIRKSGSDKAWGSGSISDDTTFVLYVKNAEGNFSQVDSQTVDVVENGEQGPAGPQGPTGTFDETTLRAKFLDSLEPSDGITKSTDGEGNTYYGLNLDAIKTGALQIGGTSKNDALFYANYGDPEVKIGGWLVSENALYTTNDALYLGTSTITATIGNTSGLELVFKAGSNFGVTDTGAMYASSGNIGGWEIGERTLSAGEGIGKSGSFYMCSNGLNGGPYDRFKVADAYSNYWRLAIGENFGVTDSGSLYCNSGKIGGFTIVGSSLYANGFHILSGEQNPTEPRIKLGYNTRTYDGILFSASTSTQQIKPAYMGESFEISIPADLYNAIKKNQDGGTKTTTTGYYGAIIIDEIAITISGINSEFAQWTIDSTKPNKITIYSTLSDADWKSAANSIGLVFDYPVIDSLLPFWVTDTGTLHATQGQFDDITTNTLHATQGQFDDITATTFGTLTIKGKRSGGTDPSNPSSSNDGQTYTFCIRQYPQSQHNNLMYMQTGDGSVPFYLSQNCHLHAMEMSNSSGTITASDLNVKNTINNIAQEYEVFFDNLKPITHKYNDGSSDRLHVGFIAQWVDEALSLAGITRQNFAGLCVDNLNTDKELWQLRYSEFIPINTWQIQKLKPRMTAAEEKIQQLELEVAELKQELAIFKNQ